MSESNLLEKAYVYVGDSEHKYKPMLVKLFNCDFHINIIKNYPYLCCFALKQDAAFDKILDPNDISKIVVDDIADLRCSSIYELAIELHLRGAFIFYEDFDVSEKKMVELNTEINHLKKDLFDYKSKNYMLKDKIENLEKQIENLKNII